MIPKYALAVRGDFWYNRRNRARISREGATHAHRYACPLRTAAYPRGYAAVRNGHAYRCACVAPSLDILALLRLLYQKSPRTASAYLGIMAPFHACSGVGFLLQCATYQACQHP